MPDGVLVAPAALLDDGLGVVDHEAAEDQQAAPQVQLEKGGAPAKNTTRISARSSTFDTIFPLRTK